MTFDVRQVVAGALTIGMFVALIDMMVGGPFAVPRQSQEIMVEIVSAQEEVVELPAETIKPSSTSAPKTPKLLWGQAGPVLQPCWSKHIASKQTKTTGYVLIKLSNGPLFHPMQVADAVIVARSLGATLVLPRIKEATKEAKDDFNKIYNVNNFAASLKGVVPVVARLPADFGSVKPSLVKVPYKVTSDYIDDIVQPLFSEKRVIQIRSVLSGSKAAVKDSSTAEMQAIRCLVTYKALQFSRHVKELGDQIVSSLRDTSDSNRFVAVDLRSSALSQPGCQQPEHSKSKKCFDASDVGNFLKSLGFSTDVSIYVTQSRWDESLDPLKELFPKAQTKEQSLTLQEDQHSEGSQLEKAVDFYVCTQSDVFVPAISGVSYVNIAGMRIAKRKTQILVPTVTDEDSSSSLQVSRVLSRFVTKQDHPVYSCFCKPSAIEK